MFCWARAKLQAPKRSVRQSDAGSGSNEVSRLGLGLPGQRENISATGSCHLIVSIMLHQCPQSMMNLRMCHLAGRVRKAVEYYNPAEIEGAPQSAHSGLSRTAAAEAQHNVSRSGRMRKAVEVFVPGTHCIAACCPRESLSVTTECSTISIRHCCLGRR